MTTSPRSVTLQRPTIVPWRYAATVICSRSFALFLTSADALISYRGFIALEQEPFEAATLAAFIAITQASAAVALTSGHNIGESFQARFFCDSGIVGGLKRWLGAIIIALVIGFYVADIWSNFAAFYQGDSIGAAAIAFVAALALSLGDELLHLFSDENGVAQRVNETAYLAQVGEADISRRYEKQRKISGLKAAKDKGKVEGERWKPAGSSEGDRPRKGR